VPTLKAQTIKAIAIYNPATFPRAKELATFTRAEWEQALGKIASPKSILDDKGKEVPFQFDDLDQDGQWDEVSLWIPDISAQSKTRIILSSTKSKQQAKPFTAIKFAKSERRSERYYPISNESVAISSLDNDKPYTYQLGGPSFENEKVAFRYFLNKSGFIDVLGKTKNGLILDSAGLGEDISKLCPWGMDITQAEGSLGLGSIMIGEKSPFADSTLRFAISTADSLKVKLINKGPVRAVFKIEYLGCRVGSKKVNLSQLIILPAGSYYYESRVAIASPDINTRLSIGLPVLNSRDFGSASATNLWHLVSSHSNQAADGDYLGLGLLIKRTSFLGVAKYTNVPNSPYKSSYIADLKSDEAGSFSYLAAAGWVKSYPAFESNRGWQGYLLSVIDKMEQPLKLVP
jgi:hypothetical protein